jgi:hypothetical protein
MSYKGEKDAITFILSTNNRAILMFLWADYLQKQPGPIPIYSV